MLEQLEVLCESLTTLPESRHFPPELLRLDIRFYREIHFKPYRVIYQIVENVVYVHCVLDGRRDLEAFLQERLLRE